jgi:alpha-galactosidase
MKNQSLIYKSLSAGFIIGLLLLTSSFTSVKTVWLTSLDMGKIGSSSWYPSAVDKNADKTALSIAGHSFAKGLGTHVKSYLWINLDGGSDRFMAYVGIDDDTSKIVNPKRAYLTTHNFEVFGDGKKLWQSGPMNYGDAAKRIDVDVKGIKTLILTVVNSGPGSSFVQADWADAQFAVSGNDPVTISPPVEEAVILTPKPSPAPRINGPKVYGCHPGNPFLYRIPTTGNRPMHFSAKNLPAGLVLNTVTGIITGSIANRGEYNVVLYAKNSLGHDSRVFKIKCGDVIALTPPMGWNDWYAYYVSVSDKKIREVADVFVKSGMADAGYQYVDIDDCWSNEPKIISWWQGADSGRSGPPRDSQGNILPNSAFPDMKAMTDYVHSKGLKVGIYSSPGPTTCAGFTGSYDHEQQDAQQFANWGFDFLKYDWCSYGAITNFTKQGSVKGVDSSLASYQKPYRLMAGMLKTVHRDMIFNLCQYGMAEVYKWGAEVGGNSWRTGADLGGELNRLFEVALRNASLGDYCHPGAWNDPDYIQIGYLGNLKGDPRPSGFTPNECYSFMSLWCLTSAPLFYSGTMYKLDDFTLNVLCNPEVIAVDQDALGKCGKVVQKNDDSFVIVKQMEDGSKAIGLTNTGEVPAKITIKWSEFGASGKYLVRDLWREKNIGSFSNEFTATVPRHGTMMLRVVKEN